MKHKELLPDLKEDEKFEGTWRLYKLAVPIHKDPGKDFIDISDGLLEEIAKVLEFPVHFPRKFVLLKRNFGLMRTTKMGYNVGAGCKIL